jgi:ankyrin repeat protein
MLVGKGVDINVQDNLGNTLLHHYCLYNPLGPAVRGLMDLGADPLLPNRAGWLPYHLAANCASNVSILDTLFSVDASSARRRTRGGSIALRHAKRVEILR